ncbi:hypothetical protein HAHI6034_11795 [Hathewaya histolytica]|uniref:Putative PemI n=1 Tax=Hathewaya histolytica TaxID=1498 RepID=A0A4V6KD47_HATHI|nr:hypothetical protein [Hathewaya histolytica]VTQ88867.1 putative PemI [Hathewaya histolytica]
MQKRILNVSLVKSGSGSTTGRVVLPSLWLKEMGISQEDRAVKVLFDGEEIRIMKNISTIEDIKEMLQVEGTGDMSEEELDIIDKVVNRAYDGVEEDREFLLEALNAVHGAGAFKGKAMHPDWNLQTVYDILVEGEWHYMHE